MLCFFYNIIVFVIIS